MMNPSVNVEFPYFVSHAFAILPRLTEALGLGDDIRGIAFHPDRAREEKDPEQGKVSFRFRGAMVEITVHYESGEEGTRGSLRKIREVVLNGPNGRHEFTYLSHWCGCGYCLGPKYPFLPAGIKESTFRLLSDEECLEQIRLHISRRTQLAV